MRRLHRNPPPDFSPTVPSLSISPELGVCGEKTAYDNKPRKEDMVYHDWNTSVHDAKLGWNTNQAPLDARFRGNFKSGLVSRLSA
jgi:hypothetical protein